ncbi:MAG: class I SAM-dependent methyltransferase [Pseudodesulfovibrio sp.]
MANKTDSIPPLSDRVTTRDNYPTESTCKICGATASLLWLREERQHQGGMYDFLGDEYVRPYFQCPDCDCVFCIDFDELTDAEFDRIYGVPTQLRKKKYANHGIEPNQESHRLEINRGIRELHMVGAVARLLKIDLSTAKILVFGCGLGLSFNLLMQNKLRVWATDYAAYDYRCTGYAHDVFVHKLAPLMTKRFIPLAEVPEGEFELITMTEVFEHFTDPVSELGGVVEKLSVGGCIVGTTGLVDWKQEEFSEWWYKTPQSHITFLSKKSFQIILEKLGCVGMIFPGGPPVLGERTMSDSQCVFIIQKVR